MMKKNENDEMIMKINLCRCVMLVIKRGRKSQRRNDRKSRSILDYQGKIKDIK